MAPPKDSEIIIWPPINDGEFYDYACGLAWRESNSLDSLPGFQNTIWPPPNVISQPPKHSARSALAQWRISGIFGGGHMTIGWGQIVFCEGPSAQRSIISPFSPYNAIDIMLKTFGGTKL